MTDPEIPRESDLEDPSIIEEYHASPRQYLVDQLGFDPVTMDMKGFEYGPTKLLEPLFVCPDCGHRDAVELTAACGARASEPSAMLRCPDCGWSQEQPLGDADG